jgi:16S rRNA C1402 N4-methylase RsmH
LKIIPFAHHLIKEITVHGDFVVDATCGNGNDTLFLSQLVGATGHVYAFDIQKQAIVATQERLEAHQQRHITYIHDSHAKMNQYLPENLRGVLAAAIFNLGYLPKNDKAIITKADSTIEAVRQLLPFLKTGGRIVLVVYHGHIGGTHEKEAVLDYVKTLNQGDYEVLCYQFLNQQNNPPFVIAIEKK